MQTVKDGGAAFPRNQAAATVSVDSNGLQWHTPHLPANDGMSLRDYFAAAALQGITAHGCNGFDSYEMRAEIAYFAYRQADAMLKEREK